MKKYILMGLLALPITTLADISVDPTIEPSYSITCTQPVEREDGSVLDIGEIAENRFYVGLSTGNYTDTISNMPPTCSLTVDATAVADGQYFYVATVVDTDGRESLYSTELVVTIKRVKPPKPPTWN